jgi:hypothetical protein
MVFTEPFENVVKYSGEIKIAISKTEYEQCEV